MIELIQKDIFKLNNIDKLPEFSFKLNTKLINNDIIRLEGYKNDIKSKYDKKNIDALISYLKKLLKNMKSDDMYEMCWNMDDKMLNAYPLVLINEPAYNINTCNYVEIENNQKLIDIDLSELSDIISFEIMFRDLGETHESVEELLKDCGILGTQDSSILTNYFKEIGERPYELSKKLKIEDTPYLSFEKHIVNDYFHSKEFKTNHYRSVIDYSCKYANIIIADDILKNYIQNKVNANLLMLNTTNITFIVYNSNEFNIDTSKLIEDISIRIFGRHFLIRPTITVF